MFIPSLALAASLWLAPAALPANEVAQVQAQGGPRMPKASLPPPSDMAALHRYVEGLAFDNDEARAMIGFDILVSGGDAYAPALSELYLSADGDVRCRWVAGQALGRLGSTTARQAIRKGLEDPMPLARLAAIQAIPLHRPQDAHLLLAKALDDKAAVVRGAAADSLGALRDGRAVQPLIQAYGHPVNVYKGKSLFVRHHIITALGQIGSPEGLETIVSALDAGEPELEDAARQALARMTGRQQAPAGPGTEAERWRAHLGLPG